jgi:hypothetical protein
MLVALHCHLSGEDKSTRASSLPLGNMGVERYEVTFGEVKGTQL